jgi:chemotaxis signal transduction protein
MTLRFDDIKKRLRVTIDQLAAEDDPTQIEQLLRSRTHAIAAQAQDVATRQQVGEVIVVRRAEALFGFPIGEVEEVREVKIARLPHRTRHICGLLQLRGQILCMVDLQPFVGAATELDHGDRSLILVLRAPGGNLAVRIDEVVGPRTLYVDELDTGHRDGHIEFISAVTRDCVEVVDVGTLLTSPELKMTGGR